jgi:serpin B
MMRMVSKSLALSAAWLLVSCSSGSSPGTGTDAAVSEVTSAPPAALRSSKARSLNPAVDSADSLQLETDNLAFGLDLYGQLRPINAGNFLFSETSIALALAMLYGGAANNTAAQIAAAAHFSLPPERLHPAFDALDLALAAPPAGSNPDAFRLTVANSTWVQQGFSYLPSYLDLLAENYGAGLFVENFAQAPETARVDINRWVSDQTQQMIPQLFDPGAIGTNVRLVLADAVYFHGNWGTPFDPSSPNAIFHAPAGDVSVPTMQSLKEDNALLWEGAGFQAAALFYSGGTTSMILVVPDAGTFNTFELGLTAANLAGVLTPSTPGTSGAVTMPKFKFATSSPLNDVLRALGMVDAFDAGADFSAIDGQHDLHVGEVIHKAIIAVDESGTTAAAATGVTVVTLALAEKPTNVLVVDRPFLFFIRHDPTGAILFQGRVVDPSK